MKTYRINGKTYKEDEIIAIHAMWQDSLNRDNIKECIELALAMIGDDKISEYVCNNSQDITEKCLQTLPEWGVWQDECLSQNSLLLDYLIADMLKEIYESQRKEF